MTLHLILFVAGALALLLGASVLFTWRTARRIEAFLPASGRYVDVPGARLHVRDVGNGPAILMIHGLAGQMAHYSYGILDQLAGDHRVVMVDRPGSGYSTRGVEAGAGLAEQAAALAGLIAALQLERPLVVGHSLGGAVALALALDYPERVGGLALVAPLTHAPEAAPAAFKGLTIESAPMRTLLAWTFATPASIFSSARVLGQVFAPEPVPADFATRGGGLLSLRPSQFLSASSDLQAVPGSLPAIEARYPELRLPVSILYGKGDRILDWKANGQALVEKIPGATLQLINGGHMLPITQAERTARFIREAAAALAVEGSRQATR
jgi:pimeloyl-ACP methyl ester carboxylesterase